MITYDVLTIISVDDDDLDSDLDELLKSEGKLYLWPSDSVTQTLSNNQAVILLPFECRLHHFSVIHGLT